MEEIKNYFEKNKNEILNFINEEVYIFPKLFLLKIDDLLDVKFYDSLKEKDNIFNYFFSFKNINIFSISRIKEDYCFKSNIDYKIMFLFFSSNHKIFLNGDKQKEIFITNSSDNIFIKNGDFLKISFVEENIYNYDNLSIQYYEKNLFDDLFIKTLNFKNSLFKKFLKNHL